VDLFQKNVLQLRVYLSDAFPIPDEGLFSRHNYEELLKSLTRRARAQGCDPDMIDAEFRTLFVRFVRQNVEAEARLVAEGLQTRLRKLRRRSPSEIAAVAS
jgi:hypothetical protein